MNVTRRRNAGLWAGFLVVVAALVAYPTFFVRFPATRDVPWATLLLSGAGLWLLLRGTTRAWREPALYRGKVAGGILLVLAVGLVGFFAFEVFYRARQLPSSSEAPRVGQQAPDFTLEDQNGRPVRLAELIGSAGAGADSANGALLIFYRGYW